MDIDIEKPFNHTFASRPRYDFEWLRDNNNLTVFVRPDVDTALIMPKKLCNPSQRDLIACIVISSPRNVEARNAIRETWGRLLKPLFLIGVRDNGTFAAVANEAEIYDDIVVEDFFDSYLNLTIKTAFAMKTFLKHFKTSKYFLKIDDDAYLNFRSLCKLLKCVPKNALVGRVANKSRPIRNQRDKWFVPRFLYPERFFPDYIYGLAYIIPGEILFSRPTNILICCHLGHLVESILKASMKIPFFTIEDVYFTGLVANKTLNYELHNSDGFKLPATSRIRGPCFYK